MHNHAMRIASAAASAALILSSISAPGAAAIAEIAAKPAAAASGLLSPTTIPPPSAAPAALSNPIPFVGIPKIYEGVGPRGADRAAFANSGNGPVFHVNYQPAAMSARASVPLDPARTPVHIVIGSGVGRKRDWIHAWSAAAVAKITEMEIPGLQLLVIDSEDNRPADADHFIAADLSDLGEKNRNEVTARVLDYAQNHGLQVAGANTFIQSNIPWAPAIQAEVRASNNPGILVNPAEAVEATIDKLATRAIVGESVPHLRLAAESPGFVDDPEIEAKAVAAFHRIVAQTPSGEVVVKLNAAAGKAGLRMRGIDSESKLRQAVREILGELKYWEQDPGRRFTYLGSQTSGPPRLLIEGLIDRLAEVDVELVMSRLADGSIDVLGFINGNPAPGEKEKGDVLGNGLLSEELQRALTLSAIEAVVAVWEKFGAVPFGNFHVEKILSGKPDDPRPALVEINATRPIGGFGVPIVREWHPEIDLILLGIRAALGLPLAVPTRQPQDSLVDLLITPSAGGTLTRTAVSEDLAQADLSALGTGVTLGANGPVFLQLSKPGDAVEGSDSPHPATLGMMIARGADVPAAVKSNLQALDRVDYDIRTSAGQIRSQKAGEEHSPADYVALPATAP